MKIFLSTIFFFISMFSLYNIEKSDYKHKSFFKINEVGIKGDFSLVKYEVTNLAGELKSKNYWDIDKEYISKKLEEDIRIDKVDIEFGNTGDLEINIVEKIPSYYINLNKEMFAADSAGVIFSYMQEAKIGDFPIINATEKKQIDKIINVFSKIKDDTLEQMISQAYYVDKNEIDLLIGKETMIKTNEEVLEQKYDVLRELYLNLSKNSKINYIDLRFDGYVVNGIGVGKDANQ